MKKAKKIIGYTLSIVMVVTLLSEIIVTDKVMADEKIDLENWTFFQGGQYNYSLNEEGNEGYINAVTMNDTEEIIDGWLREGEESINQTQSASQVSTGFSIDIENTGWDCDWNTEPWIINPWSIQASMNNVDIYPGHEYKVSFKASATKTKYCYVDFGTDVEGTFICGEGAVLGDEQIIAIEPEEQKFSYTFTNWVEANELNITFMLGAFASQYDFVGNEIPNINISKEMQWSGVVKISDFTIEDLGSRIGVPFYSIKYFDGESLIYEENSPLGGKASFVNISKEGYKLIGYKNLATGEMYDFDTCLWGDLVLEAVWEPNRAEKPTTDKVSDKELTTERPTNESEDVVTLKKVKIKKATKKINSKKLNLKLKKYIPAAGYEVAIYKTKKAAKNDGKSVMSKFVTKSKLKIMSKKLAGRKKLYVKVRVYNNTTSGEKVFGKWSRIEKVNILQ